MREKPSRPIKVLHVIARMNVGGPAVEITELMRGLDSDAISQRLVTGFCDTDEADYLETQAPDVPVTRIGGLGRRIRLVDDVKAMVALARLICASRPDIVHTHTAKAGVIGRLAAKACGTNVKIVHTHHGHLLHGYFGTTKSKAVIQLERFLSNLTDKIITVGDKVRDDLLDQGIGYREQFRVIRSGVSLGAIPDRESARRELGLPGERVIVSLVGRLTKVKRPDRFLDVVREVVGQGVDAHFLVVGGGDQEAFVRQQVAADSLPVTLLGWRTDLERVFAATDIVLLTSDNEGAPLSLIQSGLAGIPVVATRVGSVPEVVQDRVTGYLCALVPSELANHVALLSNNPQLRLRLGQSAQKIVQSKFQLSKFLEEHANVYEQLMYETL